MDEREAIEMQTTGIWFRCLLNSSFLLLFPFSIFSDSSGLLTLVTALVFITALFLIKLKENKSRENIHGIWFSQDDVLAVIWKCFYIEMLCLIVSETEIMLLSWSLHDIPLSNMIISPFFISPLIVVIFILILATFFRRKNRRRREELEMARTLFVKLPPREVKDIIVSALGNLNLEYSGGEAASKWAFRSPYTLNSGMKIGWVARNSKETAISISYIPKGDIIEPKIEAEILRLLKADTAGKDKYSS